MMIDEQMKTIDKEDLSDISSEDGNKKEKIAKESFQKKEKSEEK